MEKRYYYKDPLAAAWMAKHFGMKFTNQWKKEPFSELCDFFWETSTGDTGTYDTPVFIHSDSLHLLEPQVGDLISDTSVEEMEGMIDDIHAPKLNLPPSIYITNSANDFIFDATCLLHRVLTDANFDDIYSECFFENTRVIQRDGKPFFWPECEQN